MPAMGLLGWYVRGPDAEPFLILLEPFRVLLVAWQTGIHLRFVGDT